MPYRSPLRIFITICNPFIATPIFSRIVHNWPETCLVEPSFVPSKQYLRVDIASNSPAPETAPLVYSWLAKLAFEAIARCGLIATIARLSRGKG
jgi:hypothetical protein